MLDWKMNKQEIKSRMRIACIRSRITRTQFVKKYYGSIIPHSKGGYMGAYMSISNVLSPNSRSSIQEWLIRAIEAEEELHENPKC